MWWVRAFAVNGAQAVLSVRRLYKKVHAYYDAPLKAMPPYQNCDASLLNNGPLIPTIHSRDTAKEHPCLATRVPWYQHHQARAQRLG